MPRTTEATDVIHFAGVDDSAQSHDDGMGYPSPPAWYRDAVDAPRGASVEFPSLHSALSELREKYPIEGVPLYYQDEETGEYVRDERFKVLVNPEWYDDGGPQDTAAWSTATDSYTPADAMDSYGPFVAAARQESEPEVFGTIRTYRNGGEYRIDLFFNGIRYEDDETGTEFVIGFETGTDYFQRSGIYGELIAIDSETGAVLRSLSNRYTTPHRGDAPERVAEWCVTMIGRARKLRETIYSVIAEARAYNIDLGGLPMDTEAFYKALGFPAGVADGAAARIPTSSERKPTGWELYRAVSAEFSEEYDGKVGGTSIRRHASRMNELLYSPPVAERTALRELRGNLAEEYRNQGTLSGYDPETGDYETPPIMDELAERIESLDASVSHFRTVRDRIKTMIDEMDDEEEDETDDESAPTDAESASGDERDASVSDGDERESDEATAVSEGSD